MHFLGSNIWCRNCHAKPDLTVILYQAMHLRAPSQLRRTFYHGRAYENASFCRNKFVQSKLQSRLKVTNLHETVRSKYTCTFAFAIIVLCLFYRTPIQQSAVSYRLDCCLLFSEWRWERERGKKSGKRQICKKIVWKFGFQ